VRRDPKGVKGISPFWESIKLGDSAHLARDHDKAIAQYREAITKEPQNPVGHLRIAEAFLGKGALPEALESIAAATRFADTEPSMKARALLLTALLQERQKNFDQAADAWKVYQQFGREQPKAKVHQRTPPERMKRIQIAKQLSEDYRAVKERIAKRLKEAEETTRKNAK
jgi:tetratricopeptide (TPR) repeat protein